MTRLLVLCFCLLPLGSLAQYSIGVQGGLSLLSVWDQQPLYEDFTQASSPGTLVGLVGSYQLSEWLSLQTGLLRQQRGSRGEIALVDPQGNALGTVIQDLYVNVYTLSGNIRSHWGRRVRFLLQSGFYGEFTTNGRRVLDDEVAEDWEVDFSLFDLGISAAAGVDWRLYGPVRLGLWVKADIGLIRHEDVIDWGPGYRYMTFSPLIELSYTLGD